MSLATRCFTCGTVFRVVQDQLKVSEGWVRCGQCNEVFNALETLFDLERDTPPEWTPPQSATPQFMPSRLGGPVDLELPQETSAAADLAHVNVDVQPAWSPSRPQELSSRTMAEGPQELSFEDADHFEVPMGAPYHEVTSTPAERVDERDRLDFPDARFDPESEPESAGAASLLPIHDTTLGPNDATAAPDSPEFVLHAQRRARWNGRGARIGLTIASVALVALLLLQAVHQFRDTIAARWPGMQPVLTAWCGALGCTIQPPKRIDDIAVESTSLTRADGADAFKLSVTLRNRGALALALPSVDLSLTDAGGQLVARRMLAPKEWRVSTASLAPGAELPMQLLLAADSTRVTGYTVEVFYP